MGEIVAAAVYRAVGQAALYLLILPAGLIALGYLIYIAVSAFREWHKK